MGRRPKLYVPLTVTFFEDDRIAEAGDAATMLYLEMCTLIKRIETDGILTNGQFERIPRRGRRRELETLVAHGLVAPTPGGWAVVDWLSFNESIAEAEARRAIDRFRKELTEDLRRAIYARDGHRCVRCGATENLTIDHIIPVSLGGTHEEGNLQTMCGSCNSAKGDRPA